MIEAKDRRALALQAALLALPLFACSVATPPRLAAVQPAAAVPPGVVLAPLPEGQADTALSRMLDAALRRELGQRGVKIAGDGGHQLTAAIVQRPADVGVTTRKDGTPAESDWLSQPRKHHWFHGCRAQRVEATLVLRDTRPQGTMAIARGAFDACTASEQQVENLARTLVAALLPR